MRVHSFLPIESEDFNSSVSDNYNSVRRANIQRNFANLLRGTIAQIEEFKQRSLETLNANASQLVDLISYTAEKKVDEFHFQVEKARNQVQEFVSDLVSSRGPRLHGLDPRIFFENVARSGIDVDWLNLFKLKLDENPIEKALSKFFNFDFKSPSELLYELTATPDEYEHYVQFVKKSAKVGYEVEAVLRRFSEDYGSWNVGGPRQVDATSFIVDRDIKLTGLGLGNASQAGSYCYVAEMQVKAGRGTGGDVLYSHPVVLSSFWTGYEEDKYFRCDFYEPVNILAGNEYTLRINYGESGPVWAAKGIMTDKAEEVSFQFFSSVMQDGDHDNNGNAVTAGPLRDLYFTVTKYD